LTVIGIGNNIVTLRVQRSLAESANQLVRTYERLSTGLRINRASDDAAGLAISSTLSAQSRIYGQAIRNLNDGISALNIEEGAVHQMTGILQRLRELAVQAANGVFSRLRRLSLDAEAYALTSGYNRLVGSTAFNGMNILDGTLNELHLQAGSRIDESILFGIGGALARTVGNGAFNAQKSFSDFIDGGIRAGDLDGDGDIDLVGIHTDGPAKQACWLKNNGDGTFAAPPAIGGVNAKDIELADFNGDGTLDVMVVGARKEITFFVNDGTGQFTETTIKYDMFSGATYKQASSADFNNDGYLYLLAVRDLNGARKNKFDIYLGDGSG